MEQLERLEKILKEDKNKYSMEEIMRTMALSFEGYDKGSKTAAAIKQKITKGEWNSLINGLTMSFFMSLHASKMTPEEALELGLSTKGVFGIAIAEVKDDES